MLSSIQWIAGLLSLVSAVVFVIDVAILLPLSLVRRCRQGCGVAIFFSTYLFGAYLWLFCVGVTWEAWGGFWTLVAVLFLGVGPFFTALFAFGFTFHEWGSVAILLACYAAVFILRVVAAAILGKSDE